MNNHPLPPLLGKEGIEGRLKLFLNLKSKFLVVDITHIAKLARIELKKEELKKLETELSAILGFVEKLKEADIEGVEPMAGGADLKNIMREDEIIPQNEKREKILANAPKTRVYSGSVKKKDNYVEVKAVFE